MPNGLDWLMRPFSRGKVTYLDMIREETITLWDIKLINAMIDVEDENAFRSRPKN